MIDRAKHRRILAAVREPSIEGKQRGALPVPLLASLTKVPHAPQPSDHDARTSHDSGPRRLPYDADAPETTVTSTPRSK